MIESHFIMTAVSNRVEQRYPIGRYKQVNVTSTSSTEYKQCKVLWSDAKFQEVGRCKCNGMVVVRQALAG